MSSPRSGDERIVLQVNGAERTVEVNPSTSLLTVLRNDLDLRAAKYGCGLEQCGACTVIVGGESVQSCGLAVGRVQGREIVTLEGLADNGDLHALQEAFYEQQAAQCAYCVPGMIMSLAALLAWNDEPDDAEIRRALSKNLCRCGAHPRILRAAHSAVARLRSDREAS